MSNEIANSEDTYEKANASLPVSSMMSPAMRGVLEGGANRAMSLDDDRILVEAKQAALRAITEVTDRHGLSLDDVDVVFDGREAELSFKISVVDWMGMDRYARCLLNEAAEAKLQPSDLGREFEYKGYRFAVTGLRPRRAEGKHDVRLYEIGSSKISYVPAAMISHLLHHGSSPEE